MKGCDGYHTWPLWKTILYPFLVNERNGDFSPIDRGFILSGLPTIRQEPLFILSEPHPAQVWWMNSPKVSGREEDGMSLEPRRLLQIFHC
jgi:hypothetical protein